MSDNPEPQVLVPALVRYLRRLVTVLTVTMILGFLVIVGLFVTRFAGGGIGSIPLPDEITLPNGTTAQAFTRAQGWYAVVTGDNRILIYDMDGALLQEIEVAGAE
jgi:hypothetical protein